jgi:RHS repeat-associated protein
VLFSSGNVLDAAECECRTMTGNACQRWGSSGAEFYWITDSNPSSSITLTSSPCEGGGSGESGTAYIYAYLNASSGQCDEEWDTPCGSGGDISYGRYAKIKVTGNQKAFQHIFPEGLLFQGCYAYGSPLRYTRISITETNTECDLRLSDSAQVLRIVLNASVAQCGGSYSGSKFTIQVKFYEARNIELTQFSMLDAVSGSLTVTHNSATSFDPENFIPDIREGTANGWIEKTTYDLTEETTDHCWKVNYKSVWNCESVMEGINLTSTSPPYTLIPSRPTVYRLKVPGFKRDMHGLAGYAAQAGWSYVWGTNECYIQYQGEGKVIRFHCDSPADTNETNKRYLIRRVECLSGQQPPDNQWYVNYTYNSPAKIATIHNGSDPNDPNTVNSATVQYLYEWEGDSVNVFYKTRPTTAGTWQTQRQWAAEFDSEGRAIKYDAGCSTGCSGSGEFENVTYLDPSEYDLTGYEYLIKEKKDSNGVVILENTYQEIDFGQWVPAYWLYLSNMSCEVPEVTGCQDQTETDSIVGWTLSDPAQTPYLQLCDGPSYQGSQSIRPNGHHISKEFACYLSPRTQYHLSASLRADADLQHTSRGIIELCYDDGSGYVRLSVIDVNDVGLNELTEGQWKHFSVDVECPPAVLELPDQKLETTFMIAVTGQYVAIDDLQLSGSVWVAGNSRPMIVQQKVLDESVCPAVLRTAMTRSFDQQDYVVTEKQYVSPTEYRLTKYYYTDKTFSRLEKKEEYGSLSQDDPNQKYTTTYGGDDPNRIFITCYPNGKRADFQFYGNSGNLIESYVKDLDNDANSLRETYTYVDIHGDDIEVDWRLKTHTHSRGGTTTYDYETQYISPNVIALLKTQTDPNTSAGQQVSTYTYDDAYRVISETRKLDDSRTLITTYDYNPITGHLDSVTVNGAKTSYKYNSFGQMIRQTNPDGVKTGKSYGLGGELVSEFMIHESSDPNHADTTLAVVSQTRYTYTENGQVEFIGKYKSEGEFAYQSDMTTTPDNWFVTKHEYYADGKQKKVIEDYGTGRMNLTTEYFYTLQGEIEKVLYPTGKWVKTTRDGRGLVILEETGYGADTVVLQSAYGYDANGNLQWQSNPDGSYLIYTYDNYDRLKRTYQGSTSGPYTEKFYNNAGDVIRQIACDADGIILSDRRMEYDVLGNLEFERLCYDPNSIDNDTDFTSHYEYDIAGNLRYDIKARDAAVEPNAITTEYRYNDHGRQSVVIDPMLNDYSRFYTAGGLLSKSIDPNNPQDPNAFITENIYDAYGRLEKTIDPMGHYTVTVYNSLNQVIRQTVYDCNSTPEPQDDFAVRQTRIYYDNPGNVIRQAVMEDPASEDEIVLGVDLVSDTVYDPNGTGLVYQQKTYIGTQATPAVTTFYYDGIGRLRKTVDPKGNEETVIYYTLNDGNPAQVKQIEKKQVDSEDSENFYIITTFLEYDDFGRLYKRILDENGNGVKDAGDPATTYTYDGMGKLKTETANDGVVTYLEYDGFGNVKTKTDDYGTEGAENRTTEFVYNRLNRQWKILAYDPNDTTEDVDIQITEYEYDFNGNVTKITYPDKKSIEYIYNLFNKVDTEIQRDGTHIYYWYDQSRNLRYESDDPDGPNSTGVPGLLTEFRYDATGNLVYAWKGIDLEDVSESSFTYNGFGARTGETVRYDGDFTQTTTWTYDGSGNRLTQTHGNTVLTTTYDGLNRIKTLDRGNDPTVSYAYMGSRTKSVYYPEPDVVQVFGYDALGRVEQVRSAEGVDRTILDFIYTYDEVGNRNTVKYNHLSVPVWDRYYYDTLNRLWKVEYAQTSGFALNTEGDPLSMDALVLMASAWLNNDAADFAAYMDSTTIAGKPVPALDITIVNPIVLSEHLDRIKQAVMQAGFRNVDEFLKSVKSVTRIALNPDEKIYSLAVLDTTSKKYRSETLYDDEDTIIARIIWDNNDRMVLFAMYPASGQTVVVSMAYDKEDILTSNICTTYDEEGNIIEQVDLLAQEEALQDSSLTASRSLMATESLLVSSSSPEALVAKTDEYGYDHLGNRNTVYLNKGVMAQETLEYSHNLVNQYSGYESSFLSGAVSSTYSFAYDDNGNLSVDENGNTYFYDYRNRLIEVQDPNSDTIAEYSYDALGRRIRKTVDSVTTYFIYDPQGRVIAEYEGSTPTLAREFVYGNGFSEVLAMFTPYHAGDPDDWDDFVELVEAWLCVDPNDACYNGTYDHNYDDIVNFEDFDYFAGIWDIPSNQESNWYYLHDALGSVRGIVGGRFNRESDREFYNYDVYGKLSIQDGEESQSGNPILFAGYRFDAETGLYHTLHRTFDPETGRWLQIDPIDTFDSMNLYEFVSSNPVNEKDSFGLHRDFNLNGPKPKQIPKNGKRWDFSGYIPNLAHINFYSYYTRLFPYKWKDGTTADYAILGGELLWDIRGQSELIDYYEDVKKRLELNSKLVHSTLKTGQQDSFSDRDSILITSDLLSSPHIAALLQRFTAYWDANCEVGPKKFCNNKCDSGCATKSFWSCKIKWTVYDYYDFEWYDPWGWIGTPFHIYGYWSDSHRGIAESCEKNLQRR